MAVTVAPVYDDNAYLGEDPQLERLYDNVQAMVPGVLLPVVKMAAWNTIEEFYIRSTWRREWVEWCLPPGVNEVDFNPYDGDWLVAWVLDFGSSNHGMDRGFFSYGSIVRMMVKPPARLIAVDCSPNAERRGWALLALKPVNFNTEFDPLLFQQWFETILDGILYRLMVQPAKPYSNAQMAQFHAKMWKAGCNRARVVATKDYTNGPGRWAFPYFSAGRAKN
jgi:hypothetical protein